MAISPNRDDCEKQKFVESSVAGQPAIVVCNPDGTDVGGSGGTISKNSGVVDANTQRVTEGSTTMQAMGTDATGADTYATVKTPTADATHIIAINTGTNDAIISLDAGTTDNFPLAGGANLVLDGVTIRSGLAIQAKNLVGGSNYTGVSISCW